MKKQYIQPALVQVTLMTQKTFVILVSNNPQNNISGSIKEYRDLDDGSGDINDVNIWDEVWWLLLGETILHCKPPIPTLIAIVSRPS